MRVAPGVPLRLSDGPYPFDEPPDLVRVTAVGDRLQLLREHLVSLCRPWDKLAPLFLERYFAGIAAAIGRGRNELQALAARGGGLFEPVDWSFAAFRPLPQAHLSTDPPARAEIAFWTGARAVAIAFDGSTSLTRQERENRARIAQSGAELVGIPARALSDGGDLLALLPPVFARFWDGVRWPSSPFGPDALSELL
ncbi:MAG: hypothetical protein ACREFQ_02015 [Stellaceae bacterium]